MVAWRRFLRIKGPKEAMTWIWRLVMTKVPQALGTLVQRAVTWALVCSLLCKNQLPGHMVFVLLVEIGWLTPVLQVKSVYFKYYLLVSKFKYGQALVSRKGREVFVFCLADTPGFWVPSRSINYEHMSILHLK